MLKVTQFFRQNDDGTETCFHVVSEQGISVDQASKLKPFFQELPGQDVRIQNSGMDKGAIEIGTRPALVTPQSSNRISVLNDCGLPFIRVEESIRLLVPVEADRENFVRELFDPMTECPYPESDPRFLLSYLDVIPEAVFTVPVLEQGADILRSISKKYGLAYDPSYIDHFVNLFKELGRDPTILELFQIGQMCSDHSRHITWRAGLILGGKKMPYSLFDLAKAPYKKHVAQGSTNQLIAFFDNASVIRGFSVSALVVAPNGEYIIREEVRHLVSGAETHNYPTSVSPFQGSITGLVGCYRDPEATGRGADLWFSSAGFCTGFPRFSNYSIPGEEFVPNVYPSTLAHPRKIMIEAPAGAWAGGNQRGIPVIHGFTRAIELMVGDKEVRERYGYLKTLMYAGNTGFINDVNLVKGKAEKGMIIVQIGGPAFLVGMGGAAGSSQTLGTQDAMLDLNAVQRGNPQKAKLVGNVLRRSNELGADSPIASIHDQGAGGPCNVITELIEKSGGKICLYNIILGDQTMSAVQIWCAEYQERQGLLIYPDRIDLFRKICEEEECDMEELGVVTGDGRIVVYATPEDEAVEKPSVDLPIERVVSGLPETTLTDEPTKPYGRPLKLPAGMSATDALGLVLKQVDVGSKGFLVHHVDRSVGGLVSQQQCCGPLQLAVADVAVSALTHFSREGMASAIGEQPTIMMLNQKAGARMALVEAITNLMWARVTAFEDISFPANYMWPARHPGELCKLYRAAETLCDFSKALGIFQDGGKDSSSMAVMLGEQLIKSPETLVINLYCTIADITRVLTPDIKRPGKSILFHLDLANGKRRLGGSALANALGQPGHECPDMEDANLLKRCFNAMMQLIDEKLILSGHDTTSDGLAVTLLEMAFAGNCGMEISVPGSENVFGEFYAKEPGGIIEVAKGSESWVESVLRDADVPFNIIGETIPDKLISIHHSDDKIKGGTDVLRQMWSETSYQYEREQMTPECADAERRNTAIGRPPVYELTFVPEANCSEIKIGDEKPKVAILREKGTNGEREMAAAFKSVGFIAHDVPMRKLISGEITLSDYAGLVFPGGFSFMDVFGAGKGWALKIRYNMGLQYQFMQFRQDPSKWSLGVCNGDQSMKHLWWLYPDVAELHPLSVRNLSGMFESRWTNVIIPKNTKAKMLTGMGGTKMGVYVANGEGRFWSPRNDASWYLKKGLVGMQFIGPDGKPAGEDMYPMNPSGSELGLTSLVSECGRHLAMMPHPERSYELWQLPWLPEKWQDLKASPWLRMFQNAYDMSIGKL